MNILDQIAKKVKGQPFMEREDQMKVTEVLTRMVDNNGHDIKHRDERLYTSFLIIKALMQYELLDLDIADKYLYETYKLQNSKHV